MLKMLALDGFFFRCFLRPNESLIPNIASLSLDGLRAKKKKPSSASKGRESLDFGRGRRESESSVEAQEVATRWRQQSQPHYGQAEPSDGRVKSICSILQALLFVGIVHVKC